MLQRSLGNQWEVCNKTRLVNVIVYCLACRIVVRQVGQRIRRHEFANGAELVLLFQVLRRGENERELSVRAERVEK